MNITTIEELIMMAHEQNCTIGEAILRQEAQSHDISLAEAKAQMLDNWQVMKASITQGLEHPERSKGGLIGGEGRKLHDYCQKQQPLSGKKMANAVSYALAVAEVNATMGKIVACPTAGSCGIMPAVLMTVQERLALSDEQIVMGMFTASAFGMVIAHKASVSGAVCGCQAECGSAAAMASAASVELAGGTPEQAANACAMVIKNVLGLVCDPVAGLVEVPCAKRNAMGTSLALVCADMALAGIESVIPADEVIMAMSDVGRSLPESLRETALGGLAVTPTALELAQKILQS